MAAPARVRPDGGARLLNGRRDSLAMDGIDGVIVTPLAQIPDERGKVMHMLRADDPHFRQFGEIYFSTAYPGVIKAWHYHHRMTINYAVPWGMIKMVIYDDRPDSPTRGRLQELFIGESSYVLVTVPPHVWNGFKCIGDKMCIVANCATIVHDPAEMDRLDPFSPKIPYDWSLKHR
jgi:dTDP-4-dehydrorhamnose 3,5-epimerase